jgi:capsular polysaccharide biosynthesis protein
MLYIGLVVGAFLGICISIIVLVIVKDLLIRVKTDEETSSALDQQVNETLPTLLSSSSAGE